MKILEVASSAAIAMLATMTGISAARAQIQPGNAEPNETSGKVEYNPSYFEAYEVQNADDMLRRIPGVAPIIAGIGSAVQTRGFGSGGDQILINGRRVPGKSNEISKILARINVRSVQRIELIRGVSKDIDVQSSGLVVNIVLRAGEKVAGGGNFELNLRGSDQRLLGPDGLVNYSSSVGRLAFNLGIERNLTSLPGSNDQRYDDRTRFERYFYLDGKLQEDRVQDWRRDHNKWIYTGGLTYDFDGGARAQLNGFYQTIDITETDVTDFVQFNRAGNEQLRAQDFHERTLAPIVVWEVSGEFISRLAGGNLAVMFISNRRDQDTIDFRNRLGVGSGVIELSRSEAVSKQSEDIVRAQYGFDLTSNFNLEVGGEGARNTLNQTLQPYFDLDRDGRVEPVVLPFGAAEVVEWRGEGFVNSRWTPFPGGTINASLNVEHSKLTTNSALNPGRSLSFWKPRIDARLDTSKRGQLRLLAERKVSQLNFNNFVPSYNVFNDRIDGGNPALRPEQIWNFELGYQHRLGGDAGFLEGRLFYQSINDPIDFIPLQQGSAVVTAQGNLGKGKLYGGEAKASVRLVALGLRDAVVSLRGLLQDSQVRDAFTGRDRRLRADTKYAFDIGFRHDVRKLRLAYGVDYKHFGAAAPQIDLFTSDFYRIGPQLEAFAEYRLSKRLLVRLEAQNIRSGNQYRTREVFAPDKTSGQLVRLDDGLERRAARYAVKLKGSF